MTPFSKSFWSPCLAVWVGSVLVWFGFGLVSIWFRFSFGFVVSVGLVLGWVGLVLVWFGLVWFGLVWWGLVWFGLVGLFGLVWSEKKTSAIL